VCECEGGSRLDWAAPWVTEVALRCVVQGDRRRSPSAANWAVIWRRGKSVPCSGNGGYNIQVGMVGRSRDRRHVAPTV
jgi:hypothetical protein